MQVHTTHKLAKLCDTNWDHMKLNWSYIKHLKMATVHFTFKIMYFGGPLFFLWMLGSILFFWLINQPPWFPHLTYRDMFASLVPNRETVKLQLLWAPWVPISQQKCPLYLVDCYPLWWHSPHVTATLGGRWGIKDFSQVCLCFAGWQRYETDLFPSALAI